MFKKIEKWLKQKRFLFLIMAVLGILLDIFVFSFVSDLIILFLTVLWVGAIIGWQLEGRFSILGALIFLAMCPFLLILKKDLIAEKAAIWAYMFLVVGVFQQLIELKKEPKNMVDFDEFIWVNIAFLDSIIKDLKKKGAKRFFFNLPKGIFTRVRRKLVEVKFPAKKHLFSIIEKLTRYFWTISSAIVAMSVLIELAREVKFYHWFFETNFWVEFSRRLLIYLVFYWVLYWLAFWLIKKKWSTLKKGPLLLFVLLAFWQGNRIVYRKVRAGFEYRPYIIRVFPDIADRYRLVRIYGRNFRDMPFEGKVLIDGKEQRVKNWSDQLVVFEVDPYLSKTGNIVVVTCCNERDSLRSNAVKFVYYDSKTATPEEKKRFWKMLKEYKEK